MLAIAAMYKNIACMHCVLDGAVTQLDVRERSDDCFTAKCTEETSVCHKYVLFYPDPLQRHLTPKGSIGKLSD